VVLRIAPHDLTAVDHGGAVLREDPARVGVGRLVGSLVEIADDHRQVAVAVRREVDRQSGQRLAGGVDERGSQREVLHRIPRQHHLRKGDEMGTGSGRPPDLLPDQPGVGGKVSDGGVHLGHRQSQLRHGASLVSVGQVPGASWTAVGQPGARGGGTCVADDIVLHANGRPYTRTSLVKSG